MTSSPGESWNAGWIQFEAPEVIGSPIFLLGTSGGPGEEAERRRRSGVSGFSYCVPLRTADPTAQEAGDDVFDAGPTDTGGHGVPVDGNDLFHVAGSGNGGVPPVVKDKGSADRSPVVPDAGGSGPVVSRRLTAPVAGSEGAWRRFGQTRVPACSAMISASSMFGAWPCKWSHQRP
jgi:hypothetical protein